MSLGTIKEVIRLNDLHTVEEITQYTKAGAFCKSCVRPGGHEEKDYYLVDILKQTREEMERERLQAQAEASAATSAKAGAEMSFEQLNLIGKFKAVEGVLDEDIRPMLQMDGGNLDVIDIRPADDGKTDIYIRYLGACSGCASGASGTLYAIENVLQENLSPNIRVMPI